MCDTFKYSAQAPEVHLVRAVKYHHVFAQAAAHVFNGLCLSRSCGPGRSSAHAHTQSLS